MGSTQTILVQLQDYSSAAPIYFFGSTDLYIAELRPAPAAVAAQLCGGINREQRLNTKDKKRVDKEKDPK